MGNPFIRQAFDGTYCTRPKKQICDQIAMREDKDYEGTR